MRGVVQARRVWCKGNGWTVLTLFILQLLHIRTVQTCMLHFTRHWHSKYPNECVVNAHTVSDTVLTKLAIAMLLVSCTYIRTIANV